MYMTGATARLTASENIKSPSLNAVIFLLM